MRASGPCGTATAAATCTGRGSDRGAKRGRVGHRGTRWGTVGPVMRQFSEQQLRQAVQHALDGGQALHVFHGTEPWVARSPACFRKAHSLGLPWAHLLDQDTRRLWGMARRLGVRRVALHKKGTSTQHVDLCLGPLRRALAACQ